MTLTKAQPLSRADRLARMTELERELVFKQNDINRRFQVDAAHIRISEIEEELAYLRNQHTQETKEAAAAQEARAAVKQGERAAILKKAEANIIPMAHSIDDALADFISLYNQFKDEITKINANRSYSTAIHDMTLTKYDAHILEVLAQQGFGTKCRLGGSPDLPALGDQVEADLDIILNEEGNVSGS